MSEVTKLYVKVFLFMGLGFAVGMMLLDFFQGDSVSYFKFVFHFLFFGGFMSLLLVRSQVSNLKKLGVKDFTKENLSPIQHRIVISSLSKQALLDRLRANSDLGKMVLHNQENEIRLISKFSWHLWGEEIKIKINQLQNGFNEFDIVSRPRLRTSLFDGGNNLKHVISIEKMIIGVS